MSKLSLSRRLLAGALDAASAHFAETDDGPVGAVLLALLAAGVAGALAAYALGELKLLRAQVATLRQAIDNGPKKVPATGSSAPSAPTSPN